MYLESGPLKATKLPRLFRAEPADQRKDDAANANGINASAAKTIARMQPKMEKKRDIDELRRVWP